MGLTADERETIINWSDADGYADVYTASQTMMRRMDALCAQSDDVILVKETDESKTYRIPKKMVRISLPRQLSPETVEKRRDAMKQMWERKRNGEEV